jgi:hypothetical protein
MPLEKVPLVKKPRDRNSRLNKTAKATAVFWTRDIKKEFKLHIALVGGISSDTRLSDKLFIEM